MKRFRYTGLNSSGEEISGVITHRGDEASVVKHLHERMGLYPTSVTEIPNPDNPELVERMFMWCTLGMLLNSGVPILLALDTTRSIAKIPKNADLFEKIQKDIREGESITRSLEGEIPQYELMVINVGEETGDLPGGLQLLGKFKAGDLPIENLELTTFLVLDLMVQAGCSIQTGIEALMDLYQHDEEMFQILERIHGKLASKESFSSSFEKEATFSKVSWAMIRVGELGGVLDLSLPRLRDFLCHQYFGE